MTDDELEALVKQHAQELGEHFDAVQIFCAKADENNTDGMIIQQGRGMPCARYGLARSYALQMETQYRKPYEES